MSDEKDPVSGDLRNALDAWLQDHPGRSLAAGYLADGYITGHTDGWNRCLDKVISIVRDDSFNREDVVKELKKIRR